MLQGVWTHTGSERWCNGGKGVFRAHNGSRTMNKKMRQVFSHNAFKMWKEILKWNGWTETWEVENENSSFAASSQPTDFKNNLKRRLLFCFSVAQTKIITQKLYLLQYCLVNSLGALLANSYILNYPISVSLCVTTSLWYT